MLTRHFILLISALAIATFPAFATPADEKPGIIVRETVNEVLAILGDKELHEEERKKRVYKVASKQINFRGMSQRVLAINWGRSTDGQKQEFEDLFREILLDTYWQRIKNYNNEKVEYITGMIEGSRFATVDTVIISNKIEIPITYRMELIDGTWMAYDFLIESLSLVTRYRTEYRNIVKTRGIDGLLRQMQDRVSNFNDQH